LAAFAALARAPTSAALVDFHARHKYLLMAHGPAGQKELGRIVAQAGSAGLETSLEEYRALLEPLLAVEPGRGAHCNALLHVFGYFRGRLDTDDSAALLHVIEQYRHGDVPLALPKRMLHGQAVRLGLTYLTSQVYLLG
jgi:uncharacterized protein YbgA (DUF1722 family)